MQVALLATGDEIIIGDTLNTTSQAMAQALASDGLMPRFHLSCSDREQDIVQAIAFLAPQHDVMIITGGLGPTSDDRTRFALARFLKLPLVEHEKAFQHIVARLTRAGLPMNEHHRQQALFPPEAQLLPNSFGTAMGCLLTQEKKQFILLPGPPRECLPMFNKAVLSHLTFGYQAEKTLLKWRLFGVAEGEIAPLLDTALEAIPCEIGYRLETPYVEFKVRCLPADVATIQKIIEPLVTPHIIAPAEERASSVLRQYLEKLKQPITIIDEVTGGLLQQTLQSPSTYKKVYFKADEPMTAYFHLTGLREYWLGEEKKTSELTINYHANGQHYYEIHTIPFRSSLVLHYASEWLSFRLLHLLNKHHECLR